MSTRPLLSETIAAFAADTPYEALPEAVRIRTKLLILDAIGNAFASSGCDFAQRALNAFQTLGQGASTVIGLPARLALRDAAALNGMLIHGLDFDDTYLPGSMHLTASSVPVALALAEQSRANGKAVLTACALGLETGARLSGAARGGFVKAGFHATPVVGAFAASIAASHLMRLNESQIVGAQGIALSCASGTLQPMQEGAWTKRFHPGWAAAGGISAAALAAQGFVAPAQAYEGQFGLFRCFLGAHAEGADLARAGADLGERWEFVRTSVKLYPACHHMHAFMDAAVSLARASALDPTQIETVMARVAEPSIPLVCEPLASRQAPDSSYAAQFSLPYGIACALSRRRFGLDEIEAASYTEPALVALSRKVAYEIDPKSGFPTYRSGEVIVTLRDGQTLSRRENILPDEPAAADAITEKFMRNAGRRVAPARASTIASLVMDLEHLEDVGQLTEALRSGS